MILQEHNVGQALDAKPTQKTTVAREAFLNHFNLTEGFTISETEIWDSTDFNGIPFEYEFLIDEEHIFRHFVKSITGSSYPRTLDGANSFLMDCIKERIGVMVRVWVEDDYDIVEEILTYDIAECHVPKIELTK